MDEIPVERVDAGQIRLSQGGRGSGDGLEDRLDPEMTRKISLVAVCCSRASLICAWAVVSA